MKVAVFHKPVLGDTISHNLPLSKVAQGLNPGFVSETGQDDMDKDEMKKDVFKQDEQGTRRSDPGLGEVDGSNPGSNHYDMDS